MEDGSATKIIDQREPIDVLLSKSGKLKGKATGKIHASWITNFSFNLEAGSNE